MSYHIYIKNNRKITLGQVLDSGFVPQQVCVRGAVEAEEISIGGYVKFYLSGESSRGVALTLTEDEYDVELNIGASSADYLLATRIALAIARLNQSAISPEADDELSLADFEAKYDDGWARSLSLSGVESVLKYLVKESGTIELPGCIRPFYFGSYMLDELTRDNPGEEIFTSRVIKKIKRVQFIHEEIDGLQVPGIMEVTFPEGVKTIIVVPPGCKMLLLKTDFVILNLDRKIVKIGHQQFINHSKLLLERIDEEQYITQAIGNDLYLETMQHFSEEAQKLVEAKPEPTEVPEAPKVKGKWWQFGKK